MTCIYFYSQTLPVQPGRSERLRVQGQRRVEKCHQDCSERGKTQGDQTGDTQLPEAEGKSYNNNNDNKIYFNIIFKSSLLVMKIPSSTYVL